MSSSEWRVLFDALEVDAEEAAQVLATAMRTEIATYRGLDPGEHTATVQLQLRRVLAAARGGRATVDDEELRELATFGQNRARHGVPVDDMLRGWRIAVQLEIGRARELGTRIGVSDRILLDFVETILAWSDAAMIVTTRAHRDAELALARREQERRAAFVRGLLLGGLLPAEVGLQAAAYGLDHRRGHLAFRARLEHPDDRPALERALGLTERHRAGICTLVEGDLAGLLLRAPITEGPTVVGLGPSLPLARAAESFRLATRALSTAEGFGLAGVHDVASLGLRTAIASDADVGGALQERYVAPLLVDPAGSELLASLRAWFECGMHVERAAERLFVHANTLRARLARVEALCGARLKEPRVAFEIWWALEHHQLAEPKPGVDGDSSTGGS